MVGNNRTILLSCEVGESEVTRRIIIVHSASYPISDQDSSKELRSIPRFEKGINVFQDEYLGRSVLTIRWISNA